MSASRMVLGPSLRLFLFLGILGGFTTFSTFGYETLALFRDGEALRGVMNVVLSLLLCLASVWLGWSIGEMQLR
jgi:CrcB protein